MLTQNIDPNKKEKDTSIQELVDDVFNDSNKLAFLPEQKDEDLRTYIDKKLTSNNLNTKLEPIKKDEDREKLQLIQL